jgi:hypothetical protein
MILNVQIMEMLLLIVMEILVVFLITTVNQLKVIVRVLMINQQLVQKKVNVFLLVQQIHSVIICRRLIAMFSQIQIRQLAKQSQDVYIVTQPVKKDNHVHKIVLISTTIKMIVLKLMKDAIGIYQDVKIPLLILHHVLKLENEFVMEILGIIVYGVIVVVVLVQLNVQKLKVRNTKIFVKVFQNQEFRVYGILVMKFMFVEKKHVQILQQLVVLIMKNVLELMMLMVLVMYFI